jgi:trehalose-6-phosphate hydrolase
MLYFYKKLLKLRKEHSSLQFGDYEFLQNEDGMIYFVRTDSVEKILVVLNFTDQPKTLEVAATMKLLLSTNPTRLERENVVTILANEAMILKGEIGNDLVKER